MCNPRQFQDFRGSTGTVQSPGYPQRYRNNRKQCTLIGLEGQVGVNIQEQPEAMYSDRVRRTCRCKHTGTTGSNVL